MEPKDCIPSSQVDWFTNAIPNPDAFKEGHMTNISPTIKVDISDVPNHVEHILLGASCSAKEIVQYKALFQEFCNVFTWTYIEMTGLDPVVMEHHIDTWLDASPIL